MDLYQSDGAIDTALINILYLMIIYNVDHYDNSDRQRAERKGNFSCRCSDIEMCQQFQHFSMAAFLESQMSPISCNPQVSRFSSN